MLNLKYGFDVSYIRILGIKKSSMDIIKYIDIPYIFSYSKKEINNLLKKLENKISKNRLDNIIKSIELNTYATNMYNYIAYNKQNELTKKALKIWI